MTGLTTPFSACRLLYCTCADVPHSSLVDVGRKEPLVEDKLNIEDTVEPVEEPKKVRKSIPQRAGAAGKALLVYLGTGSIGAALVAYLIFRGAGC
jgi:hypothetical protein